MWGRMLLFAVCVSGTSNESAANVSAVADASSEAVDDDATDLAAGYVALGFLGFAILGHIAFVLWRRYLENKYGNSQSLIADDAYDISDLKYAEES